MQEVRAGERAPCTLGEGWQAILEEKCLGSGGLGSVGLAYVDVYLVIPRFGGSFGAVSCRGPACSVVAGSYVADLGLRPMALVAAI